MADTTSSGNQIERAGSDQPRRPYQTPALSRLGAVADITLGNLGTNTMDNGTLSQF